MTPHVSGSTDGVLEARTDLIANNIERVAKGRELLNKIEI
jgi:phosphoglycerate dehydrogenase-like enzyme